MFTNHESTIYIFGAIVIIVIFFILRLSGRFTMKDREIIEQLKKEYEDALKSGDKYNALCKGRKYYSAIRGGKLAIYDEQALANDISTIS